MVGEEIIMMLTETSAEGGKTALEKILSSLASSPVTKDNEEIMPSLCFCALPFNRDMELDDIVNSLYECLDNAEAEGVTESCVFILPDNPPQEKR